MGVKPAIFADSKAYTLTLTLTLLILTITLTIFIIYVCIHIQVYSKVQFWTTKTKIETTELVVSFTKAIIGHEKNPFEERFNFHAEGFKKHASLRDIYLNQLTVVSSISTPVAEAIVDHYPTYKCLIEACLNASSSNGIYIHTSMNARLGWAFSFLFVL